MHSRQACGNPEFCPPDRNCCLIFMTGCDALVQYRTDDEKQRLSTAVVNGMSAENSTERVAEKHGVQW